MKVQKAADDIETYYLFVKKGIVIQLKIFNSSLDYIVFASIQFSRQNRVTVIARHTNKNKCARLAIKNMYQYLKE